MIFGKVYKMVHKNNPDEVLYVGSTVRKLSVRWSCHKFDAKCNPDTKIYKYINEHGVDSFELTLLEEKEFETRHAMETREEHFRTLYNPPLNTRSCSRGDMTKKEYKKE